MKTLNSAAFLSIHLALLAGTLTFVIPRDVRATSHMMGSSAQTMSDMADGEVRKVDKDAKKITLRHGELKQLDMPPMTMVFQVKDPALLDKVKAGDKVKFRAQNTGGTLVITEIEVSK
jgi:Cu(I)/Ag(I) efflux system protein CusF